jgi:hypothetical protein
MNVALQDGPLAGTSVEVDDATLEEGFPIYLRMHAGAEAPRMGGNDPAGGPGVDGLLEYLYEGDGVARYVAGREAGPPAS